MRNTVSLASLPEALKKMCGRRLPVSEAIFAASKVRPEVQPIATIDYPTRAARPADGRLDCGQLAVTFGVRLPPWQEGLMRVMQGLAILDSQPVGEARLLRQVADYSMPNVSEKVVRIIHSYVDYVNRVVWKRY